MLGDILCYTRICVLLQIHQGLGGHSKEEGPHNGRTDFLDSYIIAVAMYSFSLQILYSKTFQTLMCLLITWGLCQHAYFDSTGPRLSSRLQF